MRQRPYTCLQTRPRKYMCLSYRQHPVGWRPWRIKGNKIEILAYFKEPLRQSNVESRENPQNFDLALGPNARPRHPSHRTALVTCDRTIHNDVFTKVTAPTLLLLLLLTPQFLNRHCQNSITTICLHALADFIVTQQWSNWQAPIS